MLTSQEQATLQRAFPETDSLSHEERTAYAFETWKKRKGSKLGVPPIFRKVSLFMRGVRNWLRGQGVKKAEDIFDTAERGEVGRRDFGPLSEAAESPEAAQAAMAWHGSPHRFDKFTTDAIGTGEGAQVYGHGLYFAEKKEVANYYREQLTPRLQALVRQEQGGQRGNGLEDRRVTCSVLAWDDARHWGLVG